MILLFAGDPQVGVISLPYAHTPLNQSDLTGKKPVKLPFHDLKVLVYALYLLSACIIECKVFDCGFL